MAFLFMRFIANPYHDKPIRPPPLKEISKDTEESQERRRGPRYPEHMCSNRDGNLW